MIDELRRVLYSHNDAVLLVDERADAARFVLDQATGQPVLPVSGDVPQAGALTMLIPGEEPDALQLLGAPIELDPSRHEACDRYLIYFGRPSHSRWVLLEIESVRRVDVVVDGADLACPHPFAGEERALLALANADVDALRSACRRSAGVTPAAPRCVGVDPWGLTVRERFGVMRVPFAARRAGMEEAREEVRRLLDLEGSGREGSGREGRGREGGP